MGEDLSAGARVALTLITLCSVVAIVFSILRIMKNAANQGANTLSNGLNQMLLSQFDDYDQVIVDGNKALMALSTFSGEQVAIVFQNSTDTTNYNFGCLLQGCTEATAPNPSDGKIYKVPVGSSGIEKKTVNGVTNSFWSGTIDISKGSATWNLNTKPTTRASTGPYVRTTAKYYAELIRNSTNDIIGIKFTQQN